MPELTYREAVRDALSQAMRKDDDVFIMGEDIAEMGGSMAVTQGLLAEFGPERVRNTPISEMAIVGAGIGAAMQGMRPVVEIMYEDFTTLAMEQLVNQAAKHRYMSGGQLTVPLTVRTQGGAGWSPGAQHAQQLEAWFVHVPGLKVVFASTPEDVRGLLWSSIYDDNTVLFFEHRTLYPLKGEVPEELEPIPLGQARVHRAGEDVTVVATGRLVHEALKAAADAEKEGISVEVVDPRTLQPLDEGTIVDSVKKTNRCVVAHEAVVRMGFGAEVAAVVQYQAFDWLDAPVERVGSKFTPIPFAPVMENFVVPHASDVLEAIRRTSAVASEVILPRLGQGMESGTIVRWLVSEGDEVEKGQPLYELDTDKVTQEVEAEAGGVLLKIVVQEGEVPVGTAVGYVGAAGEEVPAAKAPAAPEEPKVPDTAVVDTEAPEPTPVTAAGNGGRIKASPLARRIARERGIDLAALAGTGPDGRIVAEDVERAVVSGPAKAAPAVAPAAGVERVELTSLRKTIAKRMTEAWAAPAFQISMSADMSRAQELRAALVERHPDERPTVTDVLTKVCAIALMRHREVNALFAGDAIELHPSANVGIAVATERGLLVPVIPGCEAKTVAEIAAARADIVGRARDGKLQAADLEGGTFTISNLGMYGVEQFIAVLNPPQAAILAVGAIDDRAVVVDTAVVPRPMMTMTLTCDHRTIDGATAADFLRTVKAFLEEPGLTL